MRKSNISNNDSRSDASFFTTKCAGPSGVYHCLDSPYWWTGPYRWPKVKFPSAARVAAFSFCSLEQLPQSIWDMSRHFWD